MTGTDDQRDPQADEQDEQADEQAEEQGDEQSEQAERAEVSEEERLDRLQGDIDDARSRAKDADLIGDDDERQFHESGDKGEEMDDQTIAPPG